ncbi:Probable apyrase 6, partial [Linum perenne]
PNSVSSPSNQNPLFLSSYFLPFFSFLTVVFPQIQNLRSPEIPSGSTRAREGISPSSPIPCSPSPSLPPPPPSPPPHPSPLMQSLRHRERVNSESVETDSSADETKMDPVKYPSRSANHFPYYPIPRPANRSKSNLVVFGLVLALIALLSCYYIFSTGKVVDWNKKYRIFIDGGSTGTRIHVFSYTVENGNPVFEFGDKDAAMRVSPGLSAYSDDPESGGESLIELIEFAKERVPREMWRDTEIRLMATAGMRLLESDVQGKVMEGCRNVLRESGFLFMDEWASVISGSDEGVYAWIVANYASGSLGGEPAETTGVIELGGASAQVTFVTNEQMPPEFSRVVKFRNVTYNIYSHSFLQFGQVILLLPSILLRLLILFITAAESAEKGMILDPCTPSGYSNTEKWDLLSNLHPKGNFSKCRSAALTLLQKGKEKCAYQRCSIGSTFIPKLKGKFLATENFFHTSKFFGLSPKAFLSNLMEAGQQFCEEDWSSLKRKHRSLSLEDDDLMRYCFSSAYIVALLHDTLGIPLDDERIGYGNHVGNIPLDWAVGAFILLSTSSHDNTQHQSWISTIIGDDSPTLLSLVAIAAVVMFAVWSLSKWRKPQVKTIYDLEKGRYIVTRVRRSS